MKTKKTKRRTQRGLFDETFRQEKLEKQGDPLIKMKSIIDWEAFRPIIEQSITEPVKGPGGRPPYDSILKFKMLILQRLYNISDEQLEYQVNDRLSFMRFLDLTIADDVPDCNTIRYFRDILIRKGVIEKIFESFDEMLKTKGYIAQEGSIIDASFVEVPRQRNTRDENKQIKGGGIPEEWDAPENKHKVPHKDTDARWTKKNYQSYYGYKDHVKVDAKSKLITRYKVTDASVHDSQTLKELLDETDKGKTVHADSAYTGQDDLLQEKEVLSEICEKGCRYKKLTDEQIGNNKVKSKIRTRVEHVFGFIENSMNGSFIRTIGIKRAEGVIGLMNLTYNMRRFLYLHEVRLSS
ncbi:MAG TPA: IS5 family transposase [Spirochaetota bacterium]|nr:IS5 family transposase [Spirochaetota bacterium]